MAFRLRIDEPVEKGFRRVGAEQIDRARRQLAANADPATEVHEARKCIKRIRALLRMGREGLGETVFRTENAYFRAIAASLASARDDHVLLQTIVTLAAEHDGPATPALAHLKDAVLAHRTLEPVDFTASRADADAALEAAARRFRRLRITPNAFATLERGFVRNYRKGLERRDLAYTECSDEAFHDWRKCVQTYWRHMALLSRAWPALFAAQIEGARGLSQLLGDDHDLALLRQKLATLPAGTLSSPDMDSIEDLIQARQQALRRAARSEGEMIFADRPKAIGRRLAAVWDSAVKRKREEAAGEEPARAKRASTKIPAQHGG